MAKVSVLCITCKTHHHDHWRCSECHHVLGYMFINPEWKFCQYCGASLEETKVAVYDSADDLFYTEEEWKALEEFFNESVTGNTQSDKS